MTSINIRKLSHSEMDLYRKPLLPETWSSFPVDKDIDTQQLRKFLQRDLDRIRSGAEKDPFSNSITMLALDISRRLEKNKLNYSALEALIQRLAVGSVGFRADRLRKYIGETKEKSNENNLKNIIKELAFSKNQKLRPFEHFKEIISKDIFGIVLTAHPTFGMTPKMMIDVAKLSTLTDDNGNKISDSRIKKIIKEIFKTEQRPEKNITLDFEHKLSIIALKNLQNSITKFYEIIIQVSKDLYPNDYHLIRPKILSLHTWVGYDVDGRGDIFWNNSFSKRIKVKLEQLELYSNKISILQKKKMMNLLHQSSKQ